MSLRTLLSWFKEHQVAFDPDLIELKDDSFLYSGEGLGVFARQDLEVNSILATVPKRAVLSVRNTSLADFLTENQIGGGLGLVFAVMHETGLGDASPW